LKPRVQTPVLPKEKRINFLGMNSLIRVIELLIYVCANGLKFCRDKIDSECLNNVFKETTTNGVGEREKRTKSPQRASALYYLQCLS
jgi:hypothetical protein